MVVWCWYSALSGNPEKWARCSSLASVEKLQFIHVQNYKTPSSISFRVLIISSTLKDTNSSCSLRSLRIMHSCCWNDADRSLSRWSSPDKSWIFLSFSSCKHGWAYQGWANEKMKDLGSTRNVGRIQYWNLIINTISQSKIFHSLCTRV